MAFLDTPRTEVGNGTFHTNGHNIDDLSLEHSFHSPKKREHGLIAELRKQRGAPVRTPGVQAIPSKRPNPQNKRQSGEFTPLLKSTTKHHSLQECRASLLPNGSAIRKPGSRKENLPLQQTESSGLYDSDNSKSFLGARTPLQPIANGSTGSTPLAVPHERNAVGLRDDQPNQMSLREQENIINGIRKENFGLKLKIHFLAKALQESDPNLNHIAVKENTDLRVNKITLQKDLTKIQKRLTRSEQEAEQLKQQIQNNKAKGEFLRADLELREEVATLTDALEKKNNEICRLQERLDADEKGDELRRLREDIEDLGADLRKKDQVIEAKEDDLDIANAKLRKCDEVEQEKLETEEEADRLRATSQDLHEELRGAKEEAQIAKEELKDAISENRQAMDELEQLRGNLADKLPPASTLHIELEEKADMLESEVHKSKRQCEELKTRLNEKNHEICEMNDQVESATQSAKRREQKILEEMESLRQDQRTFSGKSPELKRLKKDLEAKSDEKDLLQTRHDALTVESRGLQADVTKLRGEIAQLLNDLGEEKRSASENDRLIKSDAKVTATRLNQDIRDLQKQLNRGLDEAAAKNDSWHQQRRELETQRQKAEQEAKDLRSSIDQLRKGESTLSYRESKLQEAANAERQRNRCQESQLAEQITDLERSCTEKTTALEQACSDLQETRASLRICEQSKAASDAKVQALEDEVDVLQGALVADAEQAKENLAKARQHIYDLKHQIGLKTRNVTDLRTAQEDALAKIKRLEASQAEAQDYKLGKEDDLAQLTNLRSRQHEMEELKAAYQDAMGQIEQSRSTKQDLAKAESAYKHSRAQLEKLQSDKVLLQDQFDGLEAELSKWRQKDNATENQTLGSGRHSALSSRRVEIDSNPGEAPLREQIRALQKERDSLRMAIQESQARQQPPWSTIKSPTKRMDDVKGTANLQRRFSDSQNQLKLFLSESRESDQNALRRISDMQRLSRQQFDNLEQQREQLEQQLGDLAVEGAGNRNMAQDAKSTIHRLRNRIADSEAELRFVQASRNADTAMAVERKDLHELLKSAKLEAETLQLQVKERDLQIQSSAAREQDVRSQLQKVRSESRLRQKQAAALSKELESLQERYESKIDEVGAKQRLFEDERRKLYAKIESSNPPKDGQRVKMLELEVKQRESRHASELKGLAKQIQSYRALCRREEGFRQGLAFGKRYLLLQVEMYQACNAADLRLLEKMGYRADMQRQKKRVSLRAVAWMVLATVRMERLRQAWAAQERQMSKKVEKVRLREPKVKERASAT